MVMAGVYRRLRKPRKPFGWRSVSTHTAQCKAALVGARSHQRQLMAILCFCNFLSIFVDIRGVDFSGHIELGLPSSDFGSFEFVIKLDLNVQLGKTWTMDMGFS